MRRLTGRSGLLAILALVLACPALVRGDMIDSINPNGSPQSNTNYDPVFNGVGWYYTPTTNYFLTGISSRFGALHEFGTGSYTMTVQIQTDVPVNGGTVLGQGSFVGDSAQGGVLGSTFAAVQLTAGTRYFVDILGIGGMGIDFGQWTTDSAGNHISTAGATTRLSTAFAARGTDHMFTTQYPGDSGDRMFATGNASIVEPILFFAGYTPTASVPEPSALALGGLVVLAMLGKVWRCR